MKYFATLGAVCAIGLSVLGGQAQADIYHLTNTGTVSSGIDTNGLFGDANADLSGLEYSAVFTFDSSLLTPQNQSFPGIEIHGYHPGAGSVVLTIGGASYTYGGSDGSGFLRGTFAPGVNPMAAVSTAQILGDSGYLTFQVASLTTFLDPFDLASPLSYAVTDADRALPTTFASWDASDFRIVFNQETLLTSSEPGGPVTGVPEPATWALMISGFGFAGTMLRRRRTLALV